MRKDKLIPAIRKGLKKTRHVVGGPLERPGDYTEDSGGCWMKCWECGKVGYFDGRQTVTLCLEPLSTAGPFRLDCGHAFTAWNGRLSPGWSVPK